MPNSAEPEYGTPTQESPEWTHERMQKAMRFRDLSLAVQQAAKRRGRGPAKTPAKQRVSLRLAPEVLEAVQATGDGWQVRVEALLRAAFVR